MRVSFDVDDDPSGLLRLTRFQAMLKREEEGDWSQLAVVFDDHPSVQVVHEEEDWSTLENDTVWATAEER